jgi:hypothetical protein
VDDPIVIHLPSDPAYFGSPSFAGRRNSRAMLPTLCGSYAKLPPSVELKGLAEGEPYLIAKPHRRYHIWCAGCAAKASTDLRPVEGTDWKGDPV